MVNHYRWDFIGLSTDNKPTPQTSEKVTDGSTYYCSDNSKLYVWCGSQWYEKTVSGGGEPYVLPIATDETLGGIKVGNNLSINAETGVLDATDTTYSAFTGTDGETAGSAGLVPAPATTDADKFLKSNGLWETVSAGGGSDIFKLTLSGSGLNQKCDTSFADIKQAINSGKLLMVKDIAVNNGTYDSYHTFGFCTYNGTIGSSGTTTLEFVCFERFSTSSTGNVKVKTLLLDNVNETLLNRGHFSEGNFLNTGYPTSSVSNKDGEVFSVQALVNVIGILQSLNTRSKSNLVSAINEVNGLAKSVVISAGTPTTSTEGLLGSLYVDTSTNACETYQCTNINLDPIAGTAEFTWTKRW